MKAPNRPTVSHVCCISLNGPQFRLIAYIPSLPLNYLQKANPRHLRLSLNCILLHVCQHLSRHFCDITFCDDPSPSFSSFLPYSGISVLSLALLPLSFGMRPTLWCLLSVRSLPHIFRWPPTAPCCSRVGGRGEESASTGSRAQEKRRGKKSDRAQPSIW